MIMSWALLDRSVDATVDDSCDNANMHYMEWWLAVETVKKILRLATRLIYAHLDAKMVY